MGRLLQFFIARTGLGRSFNNSSHRTSDAGILGNPAVSGNSRDFCPRHRRAAFPNETRGRGTQGLPRSYTLVLDGVFAPDEAGGLRFTHAPARTDREVARRVERLRRRCGLTPEDDATVSTDPAAEDAPLLAALSRASVAGQSILGRRPGAPVLRVGRDPHAPWVTSAGPRHAHVGGFDLHANRTVRAEDRAGLEHLVHYLLRPPLAHGRLEVLADGRLCSRIRGATAPARCFSTRSNCWRNWPC